MPGANCSILGCSTSRRKVGVAIFRVTAGKDEYNTNWRNKVIDIVTKYREIDKPLRDRIEKKNIYICERHYEDKFILISKYMNTLINTTNKIKNKNRIKSKNKDDFY